MVLSSKNLPPNPLPAGIWDSGGRDTYGPEKHCYTDHSTGSFLSSGEIPLKTVINAWTNEDPS